MLFSPFQIPEYLWFAQFSCCSHHIRLKNHFQGLLEHRLYVLKNSVPFWTKRKKTGRTVVRPVDFAKDFLHSKGAPR
jgi:hypothetical protein